jgi:hypothetical protein
VLSAFVYLQYLENLSLTKIDVWAGLAESV